MISWKEVVSPKTILHGRDAILRVRIKWLIFNIILQLWADVKYLPTGFGFSPKASGFYPFGDATALAGEGGVRGVGWLIQASAWNQTCHSANDRCKALASPKGCFLCFYFCPPVFIHWTEKLPNFSFNHLVCLPKTKGGWIRISRLFCYLLWRWRGLNPRPNVELISFLHA